MQKSWNDRINDARQEREEIEATTMGCYVEFIMRKFFISEDVIPEHCKVYVGRKVKSYNFTAVNLLDLVVKEVFRRRVNFKVASKSELDMKDISFRMEALWLILEKDETSYKGLDRDIYSHALLGATASLFTALSNEKSFSDILTIHLQKAFRKKAFHFHFSFRNRINNTIDLKTLKIFIAHIYQHCRLELGDFSDCTPLSFKTPEKQRNSSEFQILLQKCLDTHGVYFEFNKKLIDNMRKDSLQLKEIITLINENSQAFCSTSDGIKTRQAIAGNAVGLLVANISASVMSLKKGRTYSDDKLSEKQKTEVKDQYGIYVQSGCAFRHNKMSYMSIIVYFNISMGTSLIRNQLHKSIEAPNQKSLSPRVKRLPTKYDRKTLKIDGYLRGIMSNGELFGLSQNLLFQLIDPSNSQVRNDLMLQLLTLRFPYYHNHIGNVIPLLLKSRYIVIVAFQYLHHIDTDPARCDPEKITLLPDGGATAIIELDDNCFAVGSGSGNVTIHDSETAQVLKTFSHGKKIHPSSQWVSQMVKLTNNRLACGFSSGDVWIWNMKTSQCEAILRPSEDLNMDVVPHPLIDGLSFLRPRKAMPGVWRGGKPQGSVASLMVTKEGNLFVGYGDKSIALWDMKTYQLIKTYVGHDGWPFALLTLPNGQLVSTGEDKTLRLWNKNGCKKTIALPHSGFFAKIMDDKIIVADHHNFTELDLRELIDSHCNK